MSQSFGCRKHFYRSRTEARHDRWKAMNIIPKILRSLNLSQVVSCNRLEHYSIAIQQMVAIARAVILNQNSDF